MSGKKTTGQKIVAKNKKAFHDFHIDQTLEAGIVLSGPEANRCGRARPTCATATPS